MEVRGRHHAAAALASKNEVLVPNKKAAQWDPEPV